MIVNLWSIYPMMHSIFMPYIFWSVWSKYLPNLFMNDRDQRHIFLWFYQKLVVYAFVIKWEILRFKSTSFIPPNHILLCPFAIRFQEVSNWVFWKWYIASKFLFGTFKGLLWTLVGVHVCVILGDFCYDLNPDHISIEQHQALGISHHLVCTFDL